MISWTSDDSFTISDIEYVCRPTTGRFPSTPDQFCLLKARWQVEWYAQLLSELVPRTLVEVGMYDGASMALCEEVAHPHKLVGIDRRESPSTALNEFIEGRGLHASVRPFYDVDQTDAGRLDEILETEFGDHPLDLVVDDASHLLDATRVTFNNVYPRLRPGGLYVIEDWPMHRLPEKSPPLTYLLFELILACSDAPGVVSDVSVNRNYVSITRGSTDLDARTFDLSQRYGPRARLIAQKFL
ncbi:MAG: class SAM-dependent methyltransferase [Actinomycetia bacterium]|nr:class SAM-dependent methyltransferase [Actinomycetes bacterium]